MNIVKQATVNGITVILFTKVTRIRKQNHNYWYATWFDTNKVPINNLERVYLVPNELLQIRTDTPYERPALTFSQAQKRFRHLVKYAKTTKFEKHGTGKVNA
jgi:protein tyrosine phosphatase